MKKLCSSFLIITCILFFSFKVAPSYADTACTANISPSTMANNVSNIDFTFSITNTGSNTISRITVTSPNSSVWSIDTGSGSDFTLSGGNSEFIYFDGTLDSGLSTSITVSVNITDTPSDATWRVDADGTDCSGSLGVTVYDPNSNPPVTMSNLTISNVTSSSVTISWTTNQNSTSSVDYGTTSSYGSNVSSSTQTTSHSLNITGLSANTTYHFNAKSTGSLNTAQSGDQTFTTAAPGLTGETVTINTATTTTVTKTEVAVDKTLPTLAISTDLSKPFTQAPLIKGMATDDTSITRLEYSIDGGKNWLPIEDFSLGKKSTAFSFLPSISDDGNYDLLIRTTDPSGNIGMSKSYTIVIDRLPPQASGALFSIGPQILNSGQDGSIETIVGMPIKLTLSTVGGPINASVSAQNLKTGQILSFPLAKNSDNGLWTATLKLPEIGEYQLKFSSVDGAANNTENGLNKVVVGQKGLVSGENEGLTKAAITVYYEEPKTKEWRVWDGRAYSEKNPAMSDENGNYSLFLPAGKFYFHIEAPGYKSSDTEFFTLSKATPINANFSLKKLRTIFSLGPINLYIPDFSSLSIPFENNISKEENKNPHLGTQLPFFELGEFRSDSVLGKPTVITFLNLWSPASGEQIPVLNTFSKNKNFNTIAVVEGDSSSKTFVFAKRGDYGLPIVADPDAILTKLLGLNSLPTHYFLDRTGKIITIKNGVLSENELANILVNSSQ